MSPVFLLLVCFHIGSLTNLGLTSNRDPPTSSIQLAQIIECITMPGSLCVLREFLRFLNL
jgi:hypothetical protein